MAQQAIKRIVVFGGNGFVGSTVLRHLAAIEHVAPVSVSRGGAMPPHAAPFGDKVDWRACCVDVWVAATTRRCVFLYASDRARRDDDAVLGADRGDAAGRDVDIPRAWIFRGQRWTTGVVLAKDVATPASRPQARGRLPRAVDVFGTPRGRGGRRLVRRHAAAARRVARGERRVQRGA